MDEITCPLCKARIIFAPDLNSMTAAIADHIGIKADETPSKSMPNSEMLSHNKMIEGSLIEEMVKEIYDKYAPSPNIRA